MLGDVDAMIIARVLATNASLDEIAEALNGIEEEIGFGEAPIIPSSPRVAEVRAILDDNAVFDDGDLIDAEDY